MGGMMKGRLGAEVEWGRMRGVETPASDFLAEETMVLAGERLRAVESEATKSAQAMRRRFGELTDASGQSDLSQRGKNFENFLKIGEPEMGSAMIAVPQPVEGAFWRGLGHFIKQNTLKLFSGLAGGMGGPMMIFGFFLRGVGERDPGLAHFEEVLGQYNEKLRAYDEVVTAQKKGDILDERQSVVLSDAGLKMLAEERLEFIRTNYQAHRLESANVLGSPTLAHLETHFRAEDLGSHVDFGEREVFESPAELIKMAEQALKFGYTGQMRPGLVDQWAHKTPSGDYVTVNVEMMPSGGEYGLSEPGKRVVMKLTFSKSIGKDGIVALREGERTRQVRRNAGGRDEIISLVDGLKTETQELYIIGGPYGPTGRFGIYTLFAGKYAPPISDVAFWSQHAFVTGQGTPMNVAQYRSIRNIYDSNILEPITGSFSQYVSSENGTVFMHEFVSRGNVFVDESAHRIELTTRAYRDVKAEGVSNVTLQAAPRAASEVDGYRLFAGSDEYAAGIRVQSSDPHLVEEIHYAFLKVYSQTGSALAAFDWLLNKSQWSNSGLFQWDV